jgi:hypothetical protein
MRLEKEAQLRFGGVIRDIATPISDIGQSLKVCRLDSDCLSFVSGTLLETEPRHFDDLNMYCSVLLKIS